MLQWLFPFHLHRIPPPRAYPEEFGEGVAKLVVDHKNTTPPRVVSSLDEADAQSGWHPQRICCLSCLRVKSWNNQVMNNRLFERWELFYEDGRVNLGDTWPEAICNLYVQFVVDFETNNSNGRQHVLRPTFFLFWSTLESRNTWLFLAMAGGQHPSM